MGLLKLSGLLTDIGGKFGGSVVQRNKAGIIIRNNHWKAPQNFPKWQSQKANFAVLAATWRTLTDIQRDAWATAAPSYPATNRFGDVYTPSGYQLYMTLNGTLQAAGQVILSVPLAPEIVFVHGPSVTTLTALPTVVVSWAFEPDADDGLQVYCSRPLSAGSSIREGAFSLMGFQDDVLEAELDVTIPYLAKFGVPPVGTRVFSKIETVRTDTGQSGALFFSSDIMP